VVTAIHSAFPEHAERCSALHARLLDALPSLGPEARAPVHGSFKFSHIFLCDGKVAFIDFDGATLGDPTYDLGRFIAHLQEMKATHKLPADVTDQIAERFVDAYRGEAGDAISQRRIGWYASGHVLASQIYKAVKRYDPTPIEKLLHLAEACCPEP
jgi:aminoglycoside phosphotransferase (APT) family kinase protein